MTTRARRSSTPRRRWFARRYCSNIRRWPSLLDPVFASLTLARLQRLNARIAVDGEDASAVAKSYLEIGAFSAVTVRVDPATRPAPFALPIGIRNQVLLVLVVVATVAAAASGFVVLSPNRLVSGHSIALWAAAGAVPTIAIAVIGALLLAASLLPPTMALHGGVAALAGLLLLLELATLGQAAHAIAAGAGPAARVSARRGVLDHRRLRRARRRRRVAAARRRPGPAGARGPSRVAGGIAALAMAGSFDQLSIAREYATRHQLFAEALRRHVALVAGSVGPALAIGFPLGVVALRVPRVQGPLFAVLNTLQTVPSIALFGLLIVPLSALATAAPGLAALGVGGIGPAPAIIALVLYALLTDRAQYRGGARRRSTAPRSTPRAAWA